MAKDTYYFSHDSNARNDIKIVRLRRALGMEGYGIYFALIEILREQHNYMLPLTAITDIAFDLHSSEEKVKAVVASYDLFFVEDNQFFSARLLRSMEEFNAKRQKFIDAGRKGGEASVKHRLSIAQPLKVKVNESIGKEKVIKEDNNTLFPTQNASETDVDISPVVTESKSSQRKRTLPDRQVKFGKTLNAFAQTNKNPDGYPAEMLKAFFSYWIEPNKSSTDMRWELQKTWSLAGRLATWAKRNNVDMSSNQYQQNNDSSPLMASN